MELGKQIKKHRQEVQLSQEKLADRVYVSRQTISNWENDKSYPDVNSLVLLSEIFQISLDNLIKGDIEVMKDVIQKEEIVKMNRYGKIYTIMLIVTVVSAVPLFMWLGVWAFIPWGIIWALSMYFAFQVEKVKKDNDVQTYKEIVAFSEGKLLDDIQKQREIGKRPYQKIFLVIGSALITFVVCGGEPDKFCAVARPAHCDECADRGLPGAAGRGDWHIGGTAGDWRRGARRARAIDAVRRFRSDCARHVAAGHVSELDHDERGKPETKAGTCEGRADYWLGGCRYRAIRYVDSGRGLAPRRLDSVRLLSVRAADSQPLRSRQGHSFRPRLFLTVCPSCGKSMSHNSVFRGYWDDG